MKSMPFARTIIGKALLSLSLLTLVVAIAATGQAQDESDEYWRLKGVIVKTKDGRELVGYVTAQPEIHCPTPEVDLVIYTEVYPVSKAAGLEYKVFFTTEAQKLTIKRDDVAKIIAARRPLDGQIADWQLATVHSPEAIKWITSEKPKVFQDRFDDGYSARLISYNREIGETELTKIADHIKQRIEKFGAKSWASDEEMSAAWSKEWSDIKRGLELRRVVMLDFMVSCC